MKIIVFSTHDYDKDLIKQANGNQHNLTFTSTFLNADNVHHAKGYEGVAVFGTDHLDQSVIEYLSKNGTKFISTRSVGFDHIDLEAVKENNIKVANVPAYSPHAIAEHAVGLLMAQNRKILESQSLMDSQDFRLDSLIGFDVYGNTAGILGLGEIGKAYANIMLGFGCKVLAHDIVQSDEMIEKGVRYVSLDILLKESDIIYLSCPLNENTYHIIGENELRMMKKNAILINTARGAVIDTIALITHLKNGMLKGVCLDVYEYEKGMYFKDWRNNEIKDKLYLELRNIDRVLMTAHQGFLTNTALNQIAETTIKNFNQWESKAGCENELVF